MKHPNLLKSFLLALIAALTPHLASAYDFVVNGIAYNYCSNTFVEVTRGRNYIGNIIIPSSVTYNGKTYEVAFIDEYAFSNCMGLISVRIPNSVTSIGDGAFNFSSLKSVNIPSSVTTIGNAVFTDCTGLTSVNIPNSVTLIGNSAFSGCTGLTSVTIPNSVTSIGKNAFGLCTGLTSVTIGNSVTSIGDYAFYKCSGLTSVTIPNSVTSIGDNAFQCSGLTSVTIPNSVTTIGIYAFRECSGLTSVNIPNSVTSIGKAAFSACTVLTSMVVESGNTIYDSRNNCNAIIETATNTLISGCKNTIIPKSVTSIGNEAFRECNGLTSVTIGNSVTTIGSGAFYNCTGLTSVTIGNSVTKIGTSAFEDCTGLIAITSKIMNPDNVFMGLFVFLGIDEANCVLSVPYGTIDLYKSTIPWKDFYNIKEAQPGENTITITIGNGTISDECVPICNWYMNSFIGSECLYLKDQLADLKAGDVITSIAFYLMQGSAQGGNFNVRMKNTSISSLKNNASAYDTSCIEVNCNDPVNGNVTLEPYSGGHWIEFPLSTPFVYNGENIIIDIRNTTLGTRGGWCYFATTTYNGVRRSLNWIFANSEDPHDDGFSSGGIFSYENSSNLPNIIITYTASDIYATGISLNKTTTILTIGSTETLVATVTPSTVTNTVSWKSSNTAVATVNYNGKVTAKAVGTANITATTTDGSNLSATCVLTVTQQGGGGADPCPSTLMLSALDGDQPADNVGVELMLINSSLNLNGFNIQIKKDVGSENIQWKQISRKYFSANGYGHVILARLEDATDDERDDLLNEFCDVLSNVKSDELVIVELLKTNDCRFFPVLDTPTGIGKFYLNMATCANGDYRIFAPATPTGCSFSYTGGPEGTVSWTTDEPVEIQLSKNGDIVSAPVIGISVVGVDKNVTGIKYYNLQGIESDTPFPGINIKVTTYSDGTKSAKKILYKQ